MLPHAKHCYPMRPDGKLGNVPVTRSCGSTAGSTAAASPMSAGFLGAEAVRRLSSNLTPLSLDATEAGASSAEASRGQRASKGSHQGVSLSDFELGRVLGRGSFGTVALATKTSTGETYAIKSLSKRMLIAVRQTNSAMLEREILRRPSHPFIVRMYYAFTSATCLHLVLDYLPGGDLHGP